MRTNCMIQWVHGICACATQYLLTNRGLCAVWLTGKTQCQFDPCESVPVALQTLRTPPAFYPAAPDLPV